MAKYGFILFFILNGFPAFSQVGIGVYAGGNEPGLTFNTSRYGKYFVDFRISDVLLPQDRSEFRIRSEVMLKRRFTYFDRANFILGLGGRVRHTGSEGTFYGISLPVAVEAFPFPFPNAGLFFEVGPYLASDFNGRSVGGFRTASGINFYFFRQQKNGNANGQD
jgi:hypothetical protein